MKPNTTKFFVELERTEWFKNSGKILDETNQIKALHGWDQARIICSTKTSRDARMEANNEITVWLSYHNKERYKSWNTLVREIKPSIEKIIDKKLNFSPMREKFLEDSERIFLNALRWDILGICIGHEYRDLLRTQYYDVIEYWYLAGHFPCGWIGDVPEDMKHAFQLGKIAVF